MIITEPLAPARSHATCGQRQFRRPTLLPRAPLRTTTHQDRENYDENHSVTVSTCGWLDGRFDNDIRAKLRQLPAVLWLDNAGRCSELGLRGAGRSVYPIRPGPPEECHRAAT